MPLEINASKIVNTVTFQVDRPSMERAKKSIQELKKEWEKVEAFKLKGKAFKQGMASNAAAAQAMKNQKLHQKQQALVNASTNAADRQAAREAAQAAKRRDTAEVKRRAVALQVGGVVGRTASETHRVLTEAHRITMEYEKQQISTQKMNQLLREQTTILRRSARARLGAAAPTVKGGGGATEGFLAGRATKDGLKEFFKRGSLSEGALGAVGALGVGAIGVGALGYGIDRSVNAVRETGEGRSLLINGARNVQANPNAVMAMTQWGLAHGVDSASTEKNIDNLKDVRERLGMTQTSSSLNQKTGKWTGGDGGVNTIMDTFGWNKEMLKQYQNNPLDFIGAVVNEGQRRGMNQAQIGNLIESLGDDLMHYIPLFLDSGKQFKETLDKLKDSGAALNQETIAATDKFNDFNQEISLASMGLSNQFFTGFMKALGGVEGFKDAMKTLLPVFNWMGSEVGNLVQQFVNLINSVKNVTSWIDKKFSGPTDEEKKAASDALNPNQQPYTNPSAPWDHMNPDAVASADANGDNIYDGIASWWKGLQNKHMAWNGLVDDPASPTTSSIIPDMFTNPMNGLSSNGVGYQNPVVNMQVQPQIQINVQPDSGDLGLRVKAQLDTALSDYTNQTTLNVMSATSAFGF